MFHVLVLGNQVKLEIWYKISSCLACFGETSRVYKLSCDGLVTSCGSSFIRDSNKEATQL